MSERGVLAVLNKKTPDQAFYIIFIMSCLLGHPVEFLIYGTMLLYLDFRKIQ